MSALDETRHPMIPPLLLDDSEAAQMLGIGTSYFRRLIADGTIAPTPTALGKRRLHRRDLLERWVLLGLPHRTSSAWRAVTVQTPGAGATAEEEAA